MKRAISHILFVVGSALAGNAIAAGAGIHMDTFPTARAQDFAALQNGARLFSNYCLSCHSAALMRWNRLEEIGLNEKQIKDFLIFGEQKTGDMMTIALRPTDAKRWFGKTPPDLSVIARARTSFEYGGPDYLYTLLRGYYRDNTTATGWNNVASANIAMPHILWERQGPREASIERIAEEVVKDDSGKERAAYVRTVSAFDANGNGKFQREVLKGPSEPRVTFAFKPADAQLARQFDNDIADLVAFLVFVTDPSSLARVRIGVWALLFLGVFAVIAWWLNRVYWRDIK
ncbi:MAG TPA: cytochrome c1 [Burkholderiaceae bacterium]|nr:cytochrome c1 [Burkholderiaceae bacterium]